MRKMRGLLLLSGVFLFTAVLLRAQSDRVLYVPDYTDSLLKAMAEHTDRQKAKNDSTTASILDRIEAEEKAEEENKKVIRFDFGNIVKPVSPDIFPSAFHFPPEPQYRTGTCWAFSGISLVESEVARLTGRKIKLSEMFIVYHEYLEKCRNFIRRRGRFHISQGSEANAVLRMIKKYGAVPKDIYPGHTGDEIYDHEQLAAEIRSFMNDIEERDCWDEAYALAFVRVILDKHLGPLPGTFEFEGRAVTPREFSEQLLRFKPDDYVGVISTLALPFFTQGRLDAWDNWWNDSSYYNLPLDDWYRLLKSAVEAGYTASLGGDISEPGYNGFEDAAVVPDFDIPAAYINQDSREFRQYNRTTGDEHGIHAVAVNKVDGHEWFLIKDSSRSGRWGKFEGYFFYRDDYIRLKMLFYLVHKDALRDIMEKFEHTASGAITPVDNH
ncbi:MAG: peptidase C1 [Candidatus Zixiibacteriota bacterium]